MRYPDPFLAAHGFAAARRLPLAADASLRTYTRLVGGPRPALLMDAPPPEDVRPFASLARHFLAAGHHQSRKVAAVARAIAAASQAGRPGGTGAACSAASASAASV